MKKLLLSAAAVALLSLAAAPALAQSPSTSASGATQPATATAPAKAGGKQGAKLHAKRAQRAEAKTRSTK